MLERRRRRPLAVLFALVLVGCSRPVDPTSLRLGYFANVTHAPALTGVESGRFQRALGSVRIETRTFNAGPAALGALLGGAVDVVYVGPSPALAAFVRSRGQALRVIAGATSGGALFVVRPESHIASPEDLHGKRLATPQLGNTQDIALRTYLAEHGLSPTERGGDVRVTPLANPDILAQFRLGHLDGAWVPEPWATRLVQEAGARVFIDERDLWPGGRFATTVLVARTEYLERAGPNVARFLAAHVDEVAWLNAHPAEGRVLAGRAIREILGRPIPDRVLAAAWTHVEFTTDPLRDSLIRQAHAAQALGFLPHGDLAGLVEPAPLQRALAFLPNGARVIR
jgi:NitT/TauT family transport system substrate-binding protein